MSGTLGVHAPFLMRYGRDRDPTRKVQKGVRLVGVTVLNFDAPVREGVGLPLFGLDEDIWDTSMPVVAEAF